MTYYPNNFGGDEISLNVRVNRPYPAATNEPQEIALAVEINATPILANIKMPVSIGIAIDQSDSMNEDSKIKKAIEGACNLIMQMQASDYISVVAFNHTAKMIVPYQPVQDSKAICDKIKKLKASGGTDLSLALKKLQEQFAQFQNNSSDLARRIVLLTDGQTENEDDCLAVAMQIGKTGIPLIGLGLGSDWNSNLLEQMSQQNQNYIQGGGAEYLPNPEDVAIWFDRIFKAAQAAVISNVRLVLRLSLGVSPVAIYRIFPLIGNLGFQPISDRNVLVSLGELEKENGQSILCRCTLSGRTNAGKFRLGQLEISYDVPLMNIYDKQIRQDVIVEVSYDPNLVSQVDSHVMNLTEKVRAFKLQTIALDDIGKGNTKGATIKLNQAVTILLNQGDYQQAEVIKSELDNLQQNGGTLSPEGEKTIRFNKNKTIRF